MKKIITLIASLPFYQRFKRSLDNLNYRRDFVARSLLEIESGSTILDAGCGSQQFRSLANHLVYKGQDFGLYSSDDKSKLGTETALNTPTGQVSPDIMLDYVGNIWEIDVENSTFDAVLCTEVFEHIPFPIETVQEFARIVKPGGTLILTTPSNCLRHMDPYFFYSGFSDRWFEKFLAESGFEIQTLEPVGDYYSWMAVELWRTMRGGSLFARLILTPTFLYYYCKKKTQISTDTLCMGYHLVAKKL